jgi:hypothetical protein
MRGDMPIALTLPLHFDLRIRARRRRRLMIAVLLALAATVLAAGFWLPARAGQQDTPRTFAIGDEITLEQRNGARVTYVVTALDVVDSERAELGLDVDNDVAVLVTRWPRDAAKVGGSWRYVVTARRRDAPRLSF